MSPSSAAKTIILHSCYVKNCEGTLATVVERGEIQRKGRMYCVVGAPNDVSHKKNTHIPSISIHYFPKDVALCRKWTRFDRCHRGDFTFQCYRPSAPNRLRRRLLRTSSKRPCILPNLGFRNSILRAINSPYS